MSKRLRTALSPALALLGLAALAPSVPADGLPLNVDTSPGGVVSANGEVRYLTAEAGDRTAVIKQDAGSGRVLASWLLRGSFTVPAVAYDGSASGLSADGRTLVLIRPRSRFPRARTSLAVLDARRLSPRGVVRLRGDFSFDALSPDGASLFLIHYISRRDPTQYRVRVYDLRRGRLSPEPIVDPRESADEMYGFALTRATSPDGRWAYTLYDGGEHPFIHALDTRKRRAVCIDLDALHGAGDLQSLRLELSPRGRRLSVVGKRGPVAIVDTTTFRVSEPPAARSPEAAGRGTSAPWWAAGGAAAALVAVALLLGRRRRRRPVGPRVGDPPAEPRLEPRTPALNGSGDGREADADLESVIRR